MAILGFIFSFIGLSLWSLWLACIPFAAQLGGGLGRSGFAVWSVAVFGVGLLWWLLFSGSPFTVTVTT